MSIACDADDVGFANVSGDSDHSWIECVNERKKLVLLSFITIALPSMLDENCCLELDNVHHVCIMLTNPETSFGFG